MTEYHNEETASWDARQVREDEFETHAYLGEMKQKSNLDFQGKVMAYRERYELP